MKNGDFDYDVVTDPRGYIYEPPRYWEADGGVVKVQQGNGPWGGLSSGSGINYISIQGQGAYIQQSLVGLTAGQAYEVSFLCSSRPGYGDDETFNVQVDGNVIWETGHPPDSSFSQESAIFVAAGDTAVLRIENDSPAGDRSVLVDAVTIAVVNLAEPLDMVNPSFEDDTLTDPRGYTYMNPSGWRSSATVVAANGNAPWGGLTSGAGSNYLSIQGNGAYVEQTLTGLSSGTVYEVQFLAAERPGYGGDESLAVKIDGQPVWESTHPAETFAEYRVAFTAPSSTAVLRFENDSPAGDRSIFVDDVVVAACLDCTPTLDLLYSNADGESFFIREARPVPLVQGTQHAVVGV